MGGPHIEPPLNNRRRGHNLASADVVPDHLARSLVQRIEVVIVAAQEQEIAVQRRAAPQTATQASLPERCAVLERYCQGAPICRAHIGRR